MSQSTLAEALGLTFQQVQKYEKGANRIGASRPQQIAQILQMPVEYFFEGLPHQRGLSRRMWERGLELRP
jgi:transcriptional regulator with XRE-family HTH domain